MISAPPTMPLRDAPGDTPDVGGMDVLIDNDGADLNVDPKKAIVEIEYPDGSLTIQMGMPDKPEPSTDFDDNLAEHLDEDTRNSVVEDILRGIESDDMSRREWLDERAEAIKWLGLKIERPGGTPSDGTAPIEGMSKVYHPLLTELCLKGRANAAAELLPADGPVKVSNDNTQDARSDITTNMSGDQLADVLEKDFNHWFTTTASEYYPDTRRMLFWVYAGGCMFKKVYRDPLRRRPVTESVDAENIIVSNAATDLANADRITHKSLMRPSVLKRMQAIGHYRQVDVATPDPEVKNEVEIAKERISGVTSDNLLPEDAPHVIYETQCLYDLKGFEHKENGKPSGIPLPYIVTIDKTSRQMLDMRRDWREGDEMQQRRERYVKYSFAPALGFYDIGLAKILGNATIAATALWRMAIDSAMFANFPGSVHAKIGNRQNSTDMRAGPGQSIPFETNGQSIRDIVMPLPYHEAGSGLFNIMENVVETGMRVGGAADIQVGEGKQTAPVGTTIALIEQATMVVNDVHRGLHASQAKEFELIKELFREDPEAFWRFNRNPATQWDKDKFLAALDNSDIVPKADPNTASHMQRVMRAQALYMIIQANPTYFDIVKSYQYIFNILRIPDADQLLVQPQGQAPDPKAEASKMSAEADLQDSQTKAQELAYKIKNSAVEDENRDKDRASKEKIAGMDLQREAIVHAQQLQSDQDLAKLKAMTDIGMQHTDHAHEMRKAAVDAYFQGQQQATQPAGVVPQ